MHTACFTVFEANNKVNLIFGAFLVDYQLMFTISDLCYQYVLKEILKRYNSTFTMRAWPCKRYSLTSAAISISAVSAVSRAVNGRVRGRGGRRSCTDSRYRGEEYNKCWSEIHFPSPILLWPLLHVHGSSIPRLNYIYCICKRIRMYRRIHAEYYIRGRNVYIDKHAQAHVSGNCYYTRVEPHPYMLMHIHMYTYLHDACMLTRIFGN